MTVKGGCRQRGPGTAPAPRCRGHPHGSAPGAASSLSRDGALQVGSDPAGTPGVGGRTVRARPERRRCRGWAESVAQGSLC